MNDCASRRSTDYGIERGAHCLEVARDQCAVRCKRVEMTCVVREGEFVFDSDRLLNLMLILLLNSITQFHQFSMVICSTSDFFVEKISLG